MLVQKKVTEWSRLYEIRVIQNHSKMMALRTTVRSLVTDILQHKYFYFELALSRSFISHIVMFDPTGSLSLMLSLLPFCAFFLDFCPSFGNRRNSPAHPAMRVHYVKGLSAFGALHYTSFMFSIACF